MSLLAEPSRGQVPGRLRYGKLLALALLTHALPVFADTHDIELANNQIIAQFQSLAMEHTETANGAVLNTEHARISGYGLSGSVMRDMWLGHDYFSAQYAAAHGQSDYIGGTFGNPAYGSYTGKSGATLKDFSVRYGNGYVIDNELMVTPYGELGYHRYDRTLGYGTPSSYLETYTNRYFGIGVMGQISPVGKAVWSANALIGHTFGANIAVGLPAPFGFSARLGNSAYYRVGASFDYAFAENLHASLAVDASGWKYGASAVQQLGGVPLYEPDSRTSNTIIKAGLGYAF
jgi:hypothetical protein